jgi:putative endonuclease
MNKRLKGSAYEAEAARFLENKGYTIRARSFRVRLGEIDLVAERDNVLAFVEVKMRRDEQFGKPEEAVDQKKQKTIIQVAQLYLQKHPHPNHDIRFDVIAITGDGADREIRHIENAFGVEE